MKTMARENSLERIIPYKNKDKQRFSFDVVSLGNTLKNGRKFLACCVFPNFHQLLCNFLG